jgi:hypothetical protein
MSSAPTTPISTPPGRGRLSPLLLTVIIIAGVLLLVVVALLFTLLGRSLASDDTANGDSVVPSPTATAVETPSATPTAEDEEEPQAPVDNSTRFTSFTAPTTVVCDPDAEEKPKIQVSWTSANAESAWFAPHDGDASDGTGYAIPLSGNQDGITDNDHEFPCQHRGEQEYTLTLVGPGGVKVHEHWTVVDPDFGK